MGTSIIVSVYNNSLENAIRTLKKKCQREGIISIVKSKQHFISKSQVRKTKLEAAKNKKKKRNK